MIRTLLLAFALSASLVTVFANPLAGVKSYAQTTDQTDQSEEDWRKSRKKRDTSDIFEDIKNSGVFGSGTTQGPPNPVESLPEDSRRHLMKERAKVIATTETGQQAQDAPYHPSEEAKTDPDLAEQEKEAWDIIMTDLKGGDGQGQPGDGPNKIAIAGQGGGDSSSSSTMRGGSSQSVAEILAQIKGMKAGSLGGGNGTQDTGSGSGPGPLGTGGGSNPTGQSQGQQSTQQVGGQSQGQGQQDGSQGQVQQASAPNTDQGQGQSQSQSDQTGQSDSSADSSAESNADASAQSDASADNANADASNSAAEAEAKAQDQARAETIAEAEAQAHSQPEPIGPLDRLKKERESGNGIGSNTSASDFLKKKTD